jgi:PEP-CTERM motif
MHKLLKGIICVLVIVLAGNAALATSITGNPAADGWTLNGNALANGVYVRGNANYAFDAYSAAISVQSGSNLAIDDGANSWLVGDTVLGVGGRFAEITAAEAGWTAFSGNAVNILLGGADLGADVKLQAKFATDSGNFTASSIAPDAGNGLGSLGNNGGNGAVQVRTSGWFTAADWSAKSGALQLLDKPDHIIRNGTASPDADVARLMWNWDAVNQRVDSWEILLNTSLLDRLNPSFTGGTPAAGCLDLATVQNRDSAYTDAVVGVPEPGTLLLLATAGLGLLACALRRRS